MIAAIRMVKGMQGIVLIHAKLIAGNKNRSARSDGKIASSLPDCSGSNCGCRIIPGTCDDLHLCGKS